MSLGVEKVMHSGCVVAEGCLSATCWGKVIWNHAMADSVVRSDRMCLGRRVTVHSKQVPKT